MCGRLCGEHGRSGDRPAGATDAPVVDSAGVMTASAVVVVVDTAAVTLPKLNDVRREVHSGDDGAGGGGGGGVAAAPLETAKGGSGLRGGGRYRSGDMPVVQTAARAEHSAEAAAGAAAGAAGETMKGAARLQELPSYFCNRRLLGGGGVSTANALPEGRTDRGC